MLQEIKENRNYSMEIEESDIEMEEKRTTTNVALNICGNKSKFEIHMFDSCNVRKLKHPAHDWNHQVRAPRNGPL